MFNATRSTTCLKAIITVFLLWSIVGCAAPDKADNAFHPVWPPPPAQPRVRHIMDIHSPDDLRKPSALDNLGRLITGGGKQILTRPNSAAVVGDNLLCVTDQEWQGVHLMRMNSSGSKFVSLATDKLHFVSPVGIAEFGKLIAVSDSALNNVYLLTQDGKPAGQIELQDGFARPTGMMYDSDMSELYVVDTLANQVFVFDSNGDLVRQFGSQGIAPGQFNYPTHIFVDNRGRVFITDSMNFRVQVFDREGNYLFDIGAHGDASGFLAVPKGVGVDSVGHIYIVDSYFSNVQVFDEKGTFLLSIGGPGKGIGQFQVPSGLHVDKNNRIYICDSYNRRVQVLEYLEEVSEGVANHEDDSATDH